VKKVLILSSVYPADDVPKSFTPVVHYFAKEWVEMSCEVKVCNSIVAFPKIYYFFARLLGLKFLSSVFGFTLSDKLSDKRYTLDGVDVLRASIKKRIPHGKFSKSEIKKQAEKIKSFCEQDNFVPDVIIGHWLNPQLELLCELKKVFPNIKNALTLHDGFSSILRLYPENWQSLISFVDKIGFRNEVLKRNFLEQSKLPESKTYICYSGIPESFLESVSEHKFSKKISKFLFVGTFFKRKFPEILVESIAKSIPEKDFSISYIGDGAMKKYILQKAETFNVKNNVHLLGRINRDEIKKHMQESDCLIMISKNEVYGLVYLEAMALGCIVIASKKEGFDGVIKDGYNGFLCEAGNVEELSRKISQIRELSESEISSISKNAMQTAAGMTDLICAKKYLDDVSQ